MPLVNVMVNARAYTIACDEGEEEHLKELAAHVDAKVRELTGSVGQVGDQKLMLMAAVLITDEFFDARGRVDGHAKKAKELASSHANLDARAADAEKRAVRAAEAAEAHAAEVEKQAARAVEDAEKRAIDAEARAARAENDAERRVAEASDDAEKRGAQALSDAQSRIAELEAHASKADSIAEQRIADVQREAEARAEQAIGDANARVTQMREDAETQIAEAQRGAEAANQSLQAAEKRIADAEARVAQPDSDAGEKTSSDTSDEIEELAAMELDEASSRVERLVERLKAA